MTLPSRGSKPGSAARLSTAPGVAPAPEVVGRVSNVPPAAFIPPAVDNGGNDAPAPPRNSILERLREQRNSILGPRPPAR
jgi:hypothetical protein